MQKRHDIHVFRKYQRETLTNCVIPFNVTLIVQAPEGQPQDAKVPCARACNAYHPTEPCENEEDSDTCQGGKNVWDRSQDLTTSRTTHAFLHLESRRWKHYSTRTKARPSRTVSPSLVGRPARPRVSAAVLQGMEQSAGWFALARSKTCP